MYIANCLWLASSALARARTVGLDQKKYVATTYS